MKLSLHQQKVLDALRPFNSDVDIVLIYSRVYQVKPDDSLSCRQMQQKLAPTFRAINKKLHKACIEPGEMKRTYRYRHPIKV